ncbi:hypothetical protein ACFLUR_00390 [Chloroflexota bacterium]
MEVVIRRTWMPIIAGILDIVTGSLVLSVLFIFAIGPMIIGPVMEGTFHFDLSLLFMVIPALTIEAIAICGGICAIKRRKWRWAIAGSIAAAIGPLFLGIAAIVLIILSKNEFK